VGAIDDIVTLLEDTNKQIKAAETLHDQALDNPAVRGAFKARIKNILEPQRSALDYLAVEITKRYGSSKGLVYYPLAQAEQEFPTEMDSKMPGVASAKPPIAEAIKRHQPFQPNYEWLRELNQLTRHQKHTGSSTQLVREVYQCRVAEKATGAAIQWHGLRFVPGRVESQGGIIDLSNVAGRDPALPEPFEVGKGPTGTLVFGVPIDPATQRPWPVPDLDVESGPLHQWCFVKPHKPVLLTLEEFQGWIVRAVKDIAQAARL